MPICYLKKEKQKEWREANKEQIKERQKEYNENNKEQIKEQRKEYREANKDKISQQKSQKHTCICGKEYSHSDKKRHERSIKHQKFLLK